MVNPESMKLGSICFLYSFNLYVPFVPFNIESHSLEKNDIKLIDFGKRGLGRV